MNKKVKGASDNSSAVSHSDVQYVQSLWTIRHYVMRPTNCHDNVTKVLVQQ